ncbi:MAG: lipid IV(A) 3-deoxy-D-manno-octulosonic acid transferase [Gammaproteobacteria bacterium]|nr:lipid IV(A) 3-deoxy-D-manno-octulosonic acid transferase [Gammaproteobacteria bacterium]
MRKLYTAGFYTVLPFILVRAFWRSRKTRNNFQRLGERLGKYSHEQISSSLWLHAVSYGEAVAAEPLIRQLKTTFANIPIIITTMTATGAIRVESTWKDDSQIKHIYMPYDLPFIIKRFLKHNNPMLGVIMETELWPNLLHIAGLNKLPLVLANARLSPRSLTGYMRIKKLISPLLKNISVLCAQSTQDANRFLSLGFPKDQLMTLGNLKFDIKPPEQQILKGLEIKQQLPFKHILVAASTHAGEEEQLIDVFSQIRQKFPDTLLILVPRHPERFDEVANLCSKKGHTISRRSSHNLPTSETSIFIGDSMGELYFFYALANIAFVGGSLVPVGGHNLLEPAALKLPIVTGPHLFNFTAISDLLTHSKALHVAKDAEALYDIFCRLLADETYCNRVGAAGYEVIEENRGATEKHINVITKTIQKTMPRLSD